MTTGRGEVRGGGLRIEKSKKMTGVYLGYIYIRSYGLGEDGMENRSEDQERMERCPYRAT